MVEHTDGRPYECQRAGAGLLDWRCVATRSGNHTFHPCRLAGRRDCPIPEYADDSVSAFADPWHVRKRQQGTDDERGADQYWRVQRQPGGLRTWIENVARASARLHISEDGRT